MHSLFGGQELAKLNKPFKSLGWTLERLADPRTHGSGGCMILTRNLEGGIYSRLHMKACSNLARHLPIAWYEVRSSFPVVYELGGT